MKNFLRAVRLTLRYRWTVFFAIVCSLGVALLWSANIGTVYPIIEVVFQNKSVPQWADEEVQQLQETVSISRDAVKQHEDSIKTADNATDFDQATRQHQLSLAHAKLAAEEEALAWAIWIQPYAHKYLPTTPFSTLVIVVVLLITGTLIKDLFLVGNWILIERLAQLATFDLRQQFYQNTLAMDLSAFGDDHTANLLSRFTNDMGALTRGIATLLGKTVREPLKMIVCLVGACMICWRLLLLSMIVAPLAIYMVSRLASSIKRASRRAMEEMTTLYGVLSETFSGIVVVKAFTTEQAEKSRFDKTAWNYYRRSMRIAKYNSLIRPTTELMGISVICLAMLAGGYLVLNHQTHLFGLRMSTRPLGFGALITFYAFLIGSSDPLRKIAGVFASLQASSAAADRIYELCDRKSTIREVENPHSLSTMQSDLVFHDVNFHYTPDQPIIRNFNLRISRGETIAIVGPNGCGKSTLANLIPRFYDPVSGSISIDDIDLRQLRLEDLRKMLGLVSQQTTLFDTTVMENIRYGSPDATDEEVFIAARQARADDFIRKQLSDGYQTMVGEAGGKLSGGQRQRIALARVILRSPDILILDEATSQIDPESENLIHEVLQQFTQDRTTLLITHRASSLSLADRILVLDAGSLVDQGTLKELLDRCPLFQRLFENHFKGST